MIQVYDIHDMIVRYTGGTSFVVIFILALMYFYINSAEIYKKRITIIMVLSFVVVFNNIMLRMAGSVIGFETYYRFFWAVPVLLLTAGAMIKVIDTEKMATRKVILILLMVLAVSIGGSSLRILANPIGLPANRYNIPQDVIEVAYIINRDSDEERAVIVANSNIQINIRQYDPSFLWGVRRNAFLSMKRFGPDDLSLNTPEHIIVRVVEFGRQIPEEKELFREAVEDLEIDYIISITGFNLDMYMEQAGFAVIGRTENNTVYGRN